jgi:hypothetical protein
MPFLAITPEVSFFASLGFAESYHLSSSSHLLLFFL